MSRSPLFLTPSISFPKCSAFSGSDHPGFNFRRSRVSAASCASTAERVETIGRFADSGSSSLYEVLGIGFGASIRDIKTAYRRLARVLHPDVSGAEEDGSSSSSSSSQFIRIHEAYQTLSDPVKRADYDRSLFLRRARVLNSSDFSSNDRFSGYAGRSWETDQCW